MKRLFFFGLLSAFVLALFLIVRPVLSGYAIAAVPETAGRARTLLPAERAGVTPAPPAPKATAGAPLANVEQQIIALVNETRRKAGLPVLTVDEALQRAARSHGRDMIERGFIDSINPEGQTVEDRASRENRRAVGVFVESIGTASPKDSDLAPRFVGDWLGNPAEHQKIVDPFYTQIGVGVVPSASAIRAVQVLGRTIALTDASIPASVRTGSAMRITAAAASPDVRCDAMDIFAPDTGLSAIGPVPFGNVTLSVPAGFYKLRLRCVHGGSARLYSGPRIEVTP